MPNLLFRLLRLRALRPRIPLIWTLLGITPFAVFGAAGTVPMSVAGRSQRNAVEAKAIEVALFEKALPVEDPHEGDGELCPRDKMRVSWKVPSGEFEQGGYVDPVGPAPGANTESVNGIVVCEGFNYAYMGFEAYRNGSGWVVVPIPADEHDHMELELPEPEVPPVVEPAPAPAPATQPAPASKPKAARPAIAMPTPNLPSEIDGYATYEAQNTCSPSAKPAVSSFRNIVLQQHPATRSAGITRACHIGGRSEHKEGRAWDWWVNVNKPSERASAEQVIGWLLATDSAGNRHAMARRTGTMYIVWNRQIWSSYRANEGWRAYGGPKPHTDHVHFSFSWAGANGLTSYWSGKAVQTSFTPPHTSGSRDGGSQGFRHSKRTGEQKPRPSLEELKQEWRKRRSKLIEDLEGIDDRALDEKRRDRRWYRPAPEKTEEPSDDGAKSTEEKKATDLPTEKPVGGGTESGGDQAESPTPPVTPPIAGPEQTAAKTEAAAPPSATPAPPVPEVKPAVIAPAPTPSPTATTPPVDEKTRSRTTKSNRQRAGEKQGSLRQRPARQPRKPPKPKRKKVRRVREDRWSKDSTNTDGQTEKPASADGAGGTATTEPTTLQPASTP